MATLVSKKDFAALYGCSKAYVSQLNGAGRLVLGEDGKAVNVEATFELLGVTSDPSKAGVRERWAAYREGRAFDGTATQPAPVSVAAQPAPGQQLLIEPDAPAGPAAAAPVAAEPRASAYHDARTLREQAQARMAQLELQKALGEALDAEPTLRAVMDAHTTARTEIMMLPDRLAQLVAPEIDPRKCYDLIRIECERACMRMVEHLTALGASAQAAAAEAPQAAAEPASA